MERKRHHRTLLAVINGLSVAEARRNGQVKTETRHDSVDAKHHSMFVQDDDDDEFMWTSGEGNTSTQPSLNPAATAFIPQGDLAVQRATQPKSTQPSWMTNFGQERTPELLSPGGPPKNLFLPKNQESEPSVLSQASPFQTIDPDKPASPFTSLTTTTAPTSPSAGFTSSSPFANQGSTFFNQTTPATTQVKQTEPTPQPRPFLISQEQTPVATEQKSLFSFPLAGPVASTISIPDTFRSPALAATRATCKQTCHNFQIQY